MTIVMSCVYVSLSKEIKTTNHVVDLLHKMIHIAMTRLLRWETNKIYICDRTLLIIANVNVL